MQIDKQEQVAEIIEVWNELYHGEPRESDQGYSELQLEFMELILETLKEMDKKDHRQEQKTQPDKADVAEHPPRAARPARTPQLWRDRGRAAGEAPRRLPVRRRRTRLVRQTSPDLRREDPPAGQG